MRNAKKNSAPTRLGFGVELEEPPMSSGLRKARLGAAAGPAVAAVGGAVSEASGTRARLFFRLRLKLGEDGGWHRRRRHDSDSD